MICDLNTLFGDPDNLTYTNIEINLFTNIHRQEVFFNPNLILATERNQGLKQIHRIKIYNCKFILE